MSISPLARQVAENVPKIWVSLPRLVSAYYTHQPDPSDPLQRVAFGTSGHRGSALHNSFNEAHILATTQAICEYRKAQNISGPLFLGMDTHALSEPAFASALEVLAANGVEVMLAGAEKYTPTPAISHAILTYNKGRQTGLADGIVITPSHNPPEDGGFKYNPPNGGPADGDITRWVENRANELLSQKLAGIQRLTFEKALRADTTHRHDYLKHYVADLAQVIDMQLLRDSGIHMGVHPLGGAGVHYWGAIAEHYQLNLSVLSTVVDESFRFMSIDWDGRIRMDPSSPYAMHRLIDLKDQYDIAFACDTDHDRHGIVAPSVGLMQPNHYLSVAIDYLFRHRSAWPETAAVGKTLVSSSMIDRVTAHLGRQLYEVPVGFKYFVDGLLTGALGFGGEESAGASFLRHNGEVWSTDKDGLIPALLSAEMTAREGKDPGQLYQELTQKLGEPVAQRKEAPATPEQKSRLKQLSPEQVSSTELAGERITQKLTRAPGNNEAIGGLKVTTENGWFAARPSGTEDIYKIYAESFLGNAHLERILEEAQVIVSKALE